MSLTLRRGGEHLDPLSPLFCWNAQSSGVLMYPDFAVPAKPLSTPGVSMPRIIRISLGLLVLAVLVGCVSKRSKYGDVTGKLTYKGQPVNDAALLLYPISGADTPITIPVDSEGNFRITDVPPGEYNVVVEGSEGGDNEAAMLKFMPKEKQAEMKSKMQAQATPKTIPFPKKYKSLRTTDLKCTITDKDQPQNLELKD
jgi:hypothetical protein